MIFPLLLVGVNGSILLVNVIFNVIAPYYPQIASEKGTSLWATGHIFALMPFTSTILTPWITRNISRIGFRYSLSLGLTFAVSSRKAISMFMIGIAPSFSFPMFITLSVLSRVFSGVSFAYIYISSFALLAYEYSEQKERYISIAELFGGFGMISGPALISVLYSYLSFATIIIGLSLLMVLFVPVTLISIPSVGVIEESSKGSMWTYLKNKNIVLDLLVCCYCFLSISYLDPIVALYIDSKGYSEQAIGIGFVISTTVYITTCVFLIFYDELFSRFMFMFIGCCSCVISFFFSWTAGIFIYDDLWSIYLGLGLVGMGAALGFVVTLPSLLQEAGNDNIETYEVLSGLFEMSVAFGDILGLEIAPTLVYLFGFEISGSIIFSLGLILAVSYWFFRSRGRLR